MIISRTVPACFGQHSANAVSSTRAFVQSCGGPSTQHCLPWSPHQIQAAKAGRLFVFQHSARCMLKCTCRGGRDKWVQCEFKHPWLEDGTAIAVAIRSYSYNSSCSSSWWAYASQKLVTVTLGYSSKTFLPTAISLIPPMFSSHTAYLASTSQETVHAAWFAEEASLEGIAWHCTGGLL